MDVVVQAETSLDRLFAVCARAILIQASFRFAVIGGLLDAEKRNPQTPRHYQSAVDFLAAGGIRQEVTQRFCAPFRHLPYPLELRYVRAGIAAIFETASDAELGLSFYQRCSLYVYPQLAPTDHIETASRFLERIMTPQAIWLGLGSR